MLREDKGIPHGNIARRCGRQDRAKINYTTISRIEHGEAKQVYIETVMRLAKALGMTTDALLGMDQYAQEEEQALVHG